MSENLARSFARIHWQHRISFRVLPVAVAGEVARRGELLTAQDLQGALRRGADLADANR